MQDLIESEHPDKAAVAFHPPVLLLSFIGLGFAGRWLFSAEFLPQAWASSIGLPAVVIPLALFVWAVIAMRREGASIPTGEPTDSIVARGPYRLSRNPIYLSMVMLLLGIGVWVNSGWFLVLAVLAAVLLNTGVILPEERYLESKFGDTYLTYKRQVRRWI